MPLLTDYYRLNLTIPLLDHMITELEDHFEPNSLGVLEEFVQLLPEVLIEKSEQLDFPTLLQLYEDDLPSSSSFGVELELWQVKWKKAEAGLVKELNTPVKVLPHIDMDRIFNLSCSYWLQFP